VTGSTARLLFDASAIALLPPPLLPPRRRHAAKDDDELLIEDHNEYVDILAKRVVFSRAFVCLSSSILVAGVIEVLWIVLPIRSGYGRVPNHWLFLVVEGYVTIGLIVEILLRAVLEKREFCSKWSNVFDVAVVAGSVASSVLYAAGLETEAEMLLGTIIVMVRVMLRLLRLLAGARGFRQQQQAAEKDLEVRMDIDMDDLSPGGADSIDLGGGDDGIV